MCRICSRAAYLFGVLGFILLLCSVMLVPGPNLLAQTGGGCIGLCDPFQKCLESYPNCRTKGECDTNAQGCGSCACTLVPATPAFCDCQ
jgi:hypothetical protein